MIIKAKRALIAREFKKNIFVEIKGKKIANVSCNLNEFDLEVDILSPGFIDNHCHGFAGHDFMEANKKAYDTILNSMLKTGTTSVFATSVTQSIENTKRMFKYASIHKGNAQSQIIGIHAEGPFLSKVKKGAQIEKFILKPNNQLLRELFEISNNKLKVMTFAPEEDKDFTMVKLGKKLGIKMQIGHTVANQRQVTGAVEHGAAGITHAFNAMPKSLENQTTSFVARENIYGEIIGDGIHNSYQGIIDFINLKGNDQTILITDAIMAAGMKDGQYSLGEQSVFKVGNKVTLSDKKTIAGSASSLIDIIKGLKQNTNIALEDILSMATINVSKYHNLENKGTIEIGKDADLVCLDDNLEIKKVILQGEIQYEN